MKEKHKVPKKNDADYLIFSMQNSFIIKSNLANFPKKTTGKGVSVSVAWSGINRHNIPVIPYKCRTIGFVLDPSEINLPQADIIAYSSGALLTWGESLKAPNKYDYRKPYYPRYMRQEGTSTDVQISNLAAYSRDEFGKYSDATPNATNFANNIWRKYHGKHYKGQCNEGIAFQKGDKNPIKGILLVNGAPVGDINDALAILRENPNINLYLYHLYSDGEHIIRFLDNKVAQILLSATGFKETFDVAVPLVYENAPPHEVVNKLTTTIIKSLLYELVDNAAVKKYINRIYDQESFIAAMTLIQREVPLHASTLIHAFRDIQDTETRLERAPASRKERARLLKCFAHLLFQTNIIINSAAPSSSTASSEASAMSKLWKVIETATIQHELNLNGASASTSSSILSTSSASTSYPGPAYDLQLSEFEKEISELIASPERNTQSILTFIQGNELMDENSLDKIIKELLYPLMALVCQPIADEVSSCVEENSAQKNLIHLIEAIEMTSNKDLLLARIQHIDALVTYSNASHFGIDEHCLIILRSFLYAAARQLREESILYPLVTTKIDYFIGTVTRFGKGDKVNSAISLCLSSANLVQYSREPQLISEMQLESLNDGNLKKLHALYLQLLKKSIKIPTASAISYSYPQPK